MVQSDPFAPKPRNLLVRAFDWFRFRERPVKLTPEHVMTTLFASNFIGVVCSLPYLAWRTDLPVIAVRDGERCHIETDPPRVY